MIEAKIGEKFGSLTVIENVNGKKRGMLRCLCDCGNTVVVSKYHLVDGHTKSCGCLKIKHHITNRRIYQCWMNMKGRCNSTTRNDYKYYGAKGIKYCDAWENYDEFEAWALSNGYQDSLTLDRIDGNVDYCPENCRWISIQDQQRNRSNCHYFTIGGVTKTLNEWARDYGINRTTLHDRIYVSGLSIEDALTKPKWWTTKAKSKR